MHQPSVPPRRDAESQREGGEVSAAEPSEGAGAVVGTETPVGDARVHHLGQAAGEAGSRSGGIWRR